MYDSYRNSRVTVNMERKTKRDGYLFAELTCSQKKGRLLLKDCCVILKQI